MKHPLHTKPLSAILCAGITTLALAGGPGQVSANTFVGSSSGAFINPVGPPDMIVSGVGTSHLAWGDPNGFGTGANILDFTGTTFSVNPATSFKIGTLSFFNGSILPGTEISSVSLSLLLDFTDPAGLTRTFIYPMTIVNTPNTGTDQQNADFVTIDPVASQTIVVDGKTYGLRLVFDNPTAAGFLGGDGLEFHVLENTLASADVIGVFTANVAGVPESGSTSALAALALTATVCLRRKFAAS